MACRHPKGYGELSQHLFGHGNSPEKREAELLSAPAAAEKGILAGQQDPLLTHMQARDSRNSYKSGQMITSSDRPEVEECCQGGL